MPPSTSPQADTIKNTISAAMVGFSPGTAEHDCSRIPVDAVGYVLDFDRFLTVKKINGIAVINQRPEWGQNVTANCNGDIGVQQHIERLSGLVEKLAPNVTVLTPSTMLATSKSLLPEMGFDGKTPDLKDYAKWQTEQVGAVREGVGLILGEEGLTSLTKFGWEIEGDGNRDERFFDKKFLQAQNEQGMEFTYVNAGVNLRGGACAPYLTKLKDFNNRLLLPETADDIAVELEKITPEVSQAAFIHLIRVANKVAKVDDLNPESYLKLIENLEGPLKPTAVDFLREAVKGIFKTLRPQQFKKYENAPLPPLGYG